MNHARYFKLLKIYSDLWTRPRCRVIMSGQENIQDVGDQNRIYIVSHPTTYDLPLLVHIARNNFYVVVAEGPFAHPLVGWLFRNTGFPMLKPDNSEWVIQESCRLIRGKSPLIYSLKGYGVDFGEDVRPRTGSVRIAHYSEANIYPVHLSLEEGKTTFKYYRDRKGGVYPYTIFTDTLYFVTFCKPLLYRDYAKENMQYEDYRDIAYGIEEKFQENQKRIEQHMRDSPEYYQGLRRRGGAATQVVL